MILKVKRYKQEPSCCAFAAIAALTNYYDSKVDYEYVKKVSRDNVSKRLKDGLDTGEIGILLNTLGFKKVTIVSSDLHYLDYTWNDLPQKRLISNMRKMTKVVDGGYKIVVKNMCKWADNKNFGNKIVVNYKFGDYIRKFIDQKKPVLLSFNWTMFFQFPKNRQGYSDTWEEHAVVVCGYDKEGVHIVDSNFECYSDDLKNYRSGRYKVKWEHLMSVVGFGDLFLAEDYEKGA